MITPGAVSTGMTEPGLATIVRLAALMTPDDHTRHDRLMDGVKAQAEAFARDGVRPEQAAAVVSRAVRANAHGSATRSVVTPGS